MGPKPYSCKFRLPQPFWKAKLIHNDNAEALEINEPSLTYGPQKLPIASTQCMFMTICHRGLFLCV